MRRKPIASDVRHAAANPYGTDLAQREVRAAQDATGRHLDRHSASRIGGARKIRRRVAFFGRISGLAVLRHHQVPAAVVRAEIVFARRETKDAVVAQIVGAGLSGWHELAFPAKEAIAQHIDLHVLHRFAIFIEHAACHVTQQDWGIPVRVTSGGAARLPLVLRGLDVPG